MRLKLVAIVLATLALHRTVHSGKFKYTDKYMPGCHYNDDFKRLTFICDEIGIYEFSWIEYSCRYELEDDLGIGFCTEINFKNCESRGIPQIILNPYPQLRVLNISNGGLERLIDSDFFNLTKLFASHNKLTVVNSDALSTASNLVEIDLSFNNINLFSFDAFPVENHLEILNLSHNNISYLNQDSFQRFTQLKQLQLSHNQIKNDAEFWFGNNRKLAEIDLSFNQIHKLFIFDSMGKLNLVKLNVSHNQLDYFHIGNSSLTHLDLSSNRIRMLYADEFKNLQNLVILNLSRNFLSQVASGTFSPLKNLGVLDLSDNALETLNANAFPSQMNQLERIYIADNQLHELIGFTNTKFIGMDSNNFDSNFYALFIRRIAKLAILLSTN